MSAEVIPLLSRRRIEAAVLARVYGELSVRIGEDEALAVLGAAVESSAEEAGRAFAREAPDGPCLVHFATVVDRWREGRALDMEGPHIEGNDLTLTVERCGYVELYRAMGLPGRLAHALSCRRDAAFARGYHPALTLERSPTLAEGGGCCRFRFHWGR